ncbi:AMP-binding protein [Streptomyces sp. NPDC001255]|uniref:AMP-binding protein n=1 Tax=Streptomyces sp. NPDC001255 TaxID=3364550 RepID=UPI0036C01947
MHLSKVARRHSERTAVLAAATGEALSYRELEERSVRLARLLTARGYGYGTHAALLFDNVPDFHVAVWACQRAGLYWTPVDHHLGPDEAAYIVADCDARVLLAAHGVAALAEGVARRVGEERLPLRLSFRGPVHGFVPEHEATAGQSPRPPEREREGSPMFYSSGTTGRPKGILRPLTEAPFGTGLPLDRVLTALSGIGEDSVYLCPAPLYHAAPAGWTMVTMRHGGTVVLMDRFDAEKALDLIARHRVTHAQFVPTMLIRMLKLPAGTRTRYDTGSLRFVVHAAAPCPVEVKRRVIDWLGPIVHEFYSGSEGNCFFSIDSEEWLAHPGSVGRATLGRVVITDDEGRELPPGEVGTIWCEGTPDFAYHNDPEKTARAHDSQGRSTLGDLGRLDAEGYLHLVDRRVDLILSGGVNIYPQEIEDVLGMHPAVTDVAVVGAPDPEFGQRVRAVVQPARPREAGAALEAELLAYCRERLAAYKCPRAVEFTELLPRTATGKLLRRQLAESADTVD